MGETKSKPVQLVVDHLGISIVITAIIVGIVVGSGIILLPHPKPTADAKILSQVNGFTPFLPKSTTSTDFKMNPSSAHFSEGVLVFSLQNSVGVSVAVTEQRLPAGYDTSQLTGTPISTEYGQADITDTQAQTIGTLVTTDKTWVLLNAPTPIGTDAMKQLIESLSPDI